MSYQDNLTHTYFIFKSNRDIKLSWEPKTLKAQITSSGRQAKTVMGKVDLRLGTESIQLCPIDRDREENQKLTGRGETCK